MGSQTPRSGATALLAPAPAQPAGSLIAMQQNAVTDCDLDPARLDDAGAAILAALRIHRAVVNGVPPAEAPTLAPAPPLPPAARFVIDETAAAEPARLAELHRDGVRAVRFVLPAAGERLAQRLDDVSRVADRLAPLGWHVELVLPADIRGLARWEWRLTCLPVALCLANIAALARPRGADDRDLAFVLELLQMGRTWLKLSGAALASPTATLARFVADAAALRRDRIVWGSGEADIAAALAALEVLLPATADRAVVLGDNPRRLYGFETEAQPG